MNWYRVEFQTGDVEEFVFKNDTELMKHLKVNGYNVANVKWVWRIGTQVKFFGTKETP